VASARIMSVTLSVAETKVLLQEVPAAYHTQINDVLLTLVQAFAQWTGERSLLVNLEGHGRERYDNVACRARWAGLHLFSPPDLGEASDPGEVESSQSSCGASRSLDYRYAALSQ